MGAILMNAAYRLRCDISGCRNVAKYGIGSPGSGKGTHFLICEECVKSLVESLPDELKPVKIVEVEKEVEAKNETQDKDIPDNITEIKDSLDLVGDMLTAPKAKAKPKPKKKKI